MKKMQRIVELQQGCVGNMEKWMTCNNTPIIDIVVVYKSFNMKDFLL